MNRHSAIVSIRAKLAAGEYSIGSWMQIPHPSVAEIMGQAGYDWVAIDMEHGAIGPHQLPDLCRALELGNTLPLARIAYGHPKDCKQALDAGVGGIIVPMIESAAQLLAMRDACRWPPAGNRGVGFSRANLFGKNFEDYREEAQAPLLVAMIEHHRALDELEAILAIDGLDAILIGPYDLSASIGLTAQFDHPAFCSSIEKIRALATLANIPVGLHVVDPSMEQLRRRLDEGYRFVAYSIDAAMLQSVASPNKLDLEFMKNPGPACGSSDKRNATYHDNYSPAEYFRYLINSLTPVIFDVGAHRGESVRFFKEIFPEGILYSFEPDPDNFKELEEICVEINSVCLGKCIAINKAIGAKSELTRFYRQGLSHLGSLLPINRLSKDSLGYAETAINEPITVEVTTIDKISEEANIRHIDLLKIDVQGFEVGALRGAVRMLKNTTCCSVEVSFYDFYEMKSSLLLIEQEMHAASMVLWDISKVSKNPRNFRTDWAELVYVKKDFF